MASAMDVVYDLFNSSHLRYQSGHCNIKLIGTEMEKDMGKSRREVIKLTLSAIADARIAGGLSATTILSGCGFVVRNSNNSSSGTSAIVAPTNLAYASLSNGVVGSAFGPFNPTVSGSVTQYSVTPALPPGVSLNPATGVISGTPTKASPVSSYVVTASNAGGSTTASISITIKEAIVVVAATTSPTALTPVSLTVLGLDFTSNFSVQLTNASGYSANLTPIRTDSVNGVVVVAAPMYINPATGTTSALSANLQITQLGISSNLLALQIADLPSVSSYGVSPGVISRGFLNAQSVYLGMSVNALQAMRALSTSKAKTTVLQSHHTQQQISATEARSNVDLIVSAKQSSLSVGKTSSGVQISFNANSVDIQDRIIGLYLQSIGYLPTSIYPNVPAFVHPAIQSASRKPHIARQRIAFSALASTFPNMQDFIGRPLATTRPIIDESTPYVTPHARKLTQKASLDATPVAQLSPSQIITGLGTLSGAVGITNSAIQANGATNSLDQALAFGQGVTTAVAVLAALASAPELVAAATIVGTGYALAALANDGYKWYTASSAIAVANAEGNNAAATAAQKQLTEAQTNVALDAVGGILGVFGVPSEVAQDLGWGAQVVNALSATENGASGFAVQGLSLITNTAGLLVTTNGSEASADAATSQASNAEIPASGTSFGLLEGTTNVTDSNGPILSPLSGVLLSDPTTSTDFTTLAGTDGSYSMIVPLGVSGFDYPKMDIETYDPISDVTTGAPILLNLSQLTATTPLTVPTLSGTCTDTDAGSPDSDDPDCD